MRPHRYQLSLYAYHTQGSDSEEDSEPELSSTSNITRDREEDEKIQLVQKRARMIYATNARDKVGHVEIYRFLAQNLGKHSYLTLIS